MAVPLAESCSSAATEQRMTFEALYDEHFDYVWRVLRRLGVPQSDLADVAQEVFLVVHRRLPDFEQRARVTTWLFTICLHAARDRRRRAHLRREVSDDDLESVATGPEPSSALERRDDYQLFEAGLDAMNSDQRAVFVLFELEGKRCEEIAAALAIPLGTAYSRLRLAREAFRRGVVRAAARRRGSLERSEGSS